MPLSAPRWRVATTIAMALAVSLSASPVKGQDDASASMCVMTLDEIRDVTGLPFATMSEARGACTYASDPSVDMYALDLRIDTEASLDSVRFAYDRGGHETTVGEYPAWSSDDGLFIDLGGRLLVIQPVFFLSDAAPDPVPVQLPVAEVVVERVAPAIEAAFGSEDRLRALFPSEFDGLPVYVDVMNGQDFLGYVDLGTAGIEAVLAEQGLTLGDLSVGTAYFGGADIFVLHAAGLDASLLLPPVTERLTAMGGPPSQETYGGRELLAYPNQGMWIYASGDALWVISQTDQTTLETVIGALP